MNRTISTLAAELFSTMFVVASFGYSDDDEKPEIAKIMETVKVKNDAVRKTVASVTSWNKADNRALADEVDELLSSQDLPGPTTMQPSK